MKLEEIKKELKAIEEKEEQAKAKVKKDLEDTKAKLDETSKEIEETFNTGDTTKGQELVKTKLELEEKINYLETFINKRQSLQLITEEQANKYIKDIYKCFNDKHDLVVEKLKKFTKEIAPLVEDAKKENETASQLVNFIYQKLLKDRTNTYQEDYKKTGVYNSFNNFATQLKNRGF